MEFFRIKKDIPFMKYALFLNAVSFITFALAVFFLFSRGLVNLWYGGKKKLKSLSLGQVWKPEPQADTAPTGASLASIATSPLQSPAKTDQP